MTHPPRYRVFDGHNDLLHRLWKNYRSDPAQAFLNGTDDGHLDWPRMQRGGFIGGLFALWVPSEPIDGERKTTAPWQDSPVLSQFEIPALCQSQAYIFNVLSMLLRIEEACPQQLKICRSVVDIQQAMASRQVAAVIHMEGSEAIDQSLCLLDVLHAAGLRSLGPVWSRPTRFGDGVKFRFPGSPDTGTGLNQSGLALIKSCYRKGILVDLSHMDARGFWQTAELAEAPLVASHSNAHALCAQSRNLTDDQLHAIRDSHGVVGVNFGAQFLATNGQVNPDEGEEQQVRHIEYLLEHVGEDCVSLGSDFDGCPTPDRFGDVTGLPKIFTALEKRGYDASLLNKIAHKNWLRVLKATWGN
ncbi:dipeptidase [Celerinatantimonas diazotrophica]|uniref:Membrane dipeptidase n=1 Tax=Celerinatantimonas diazotrophica TaxID=412034 RepID=A0A4R1J8Q6_9GAMM|nr:dipeptidase [Celerinatantimonas diazotrophica]TCK46426.1 membrane dipeptidase [Celerinatantimonas diazotrophica]CAG9295197.1 hypothetical protein CEDIAZO_00309 [Celerinatantimonas diazotrophica]